MEDIAKKLNLRIVKIIGSGTLQDAIDLTRKGFHSEFGNFIAEGIVLRPKVQLFNRKGERIITKIKHKDKFAIPAKSESKVSGVSDV